ncbi:MAG: CopG family antitoxin [Anaerolineae bacterium]|nr:CopG family antitoxin [Anaerolineae bacterium]
MDENKLSSTSKADSLEKMGEFWDTHDFTDFDTDAPDVTFEIASAVPIEVDLLSAVEKEAHLRGVSVETLVNLWLHQKLVEQQALSKAGSSA